MIIQYRVVVYYCIGNTRNPDFDPLENVLNFRQLINEMQHLTDDSLSLTSEITTVHGGCLL
jgi:hypothetical protein